MDFINKIYRLSDRNRLEEVLEIVSSYIIENSLSFNENLIDEFLEDLDINKLRIELTFKLLDFLYYYKDGLNNYNLFVEKVNNYINNLQLNEYSEQIKKYK